MAWWLFVMSGLSAFTIAILAGYAFHLETIWMVIVGVVSGIALWYGSTQARKREIKQETEESVRRATNPTKEEKEMFEAFEILATDLEMKKRKEARAAARRESSEPK